MLKTVTTTSQSLRTILGNTSADIMALNTNSTWLYNIIIQVLGAQNVYVEFGTAATTTGWIKITTGNSFTFTDVRLEDCYLIAESANNTDVRISAN